MTRRSEAIEQLLVVVPVLQAEGWIVPPFAVLVGENGMVTASLRGRLLARFDECAPGLSVGITVDPRARHVVVPPRAVGQ